MNLNEFHRANQLRGRTAFAPEHEAPALVLCIQEELGELAGAILGVTKEKQRKVHLTNDDVLDAVADTVTYLSLLAGKCNIQDLARLYVIALQAAPSGRDLFHLSAQCAVWHGHIAANLNRPELQWQIAGLWSNLIRIAELAGCIDFPLLLGRTFNMVSDRAGSDLKVDLSG